MSNEPWKKYISLSDALNDEQKRIFIMNLLQEMRREEVIRPLDAKRGRGAKWVLHKAIGERNGKPEIMQS